MLNIISTYARSNRINGPNKVFMNTVKGLDSIGYPYVINRALDSTDLVWIHDDIVALKYVKPMERNVIYGPNLYNNPSMIEEKINLKNGLYLQPSEWVKSTWKLMGFDKCRIKVWPAGVDTNKFPKRNKQSVNSNTILLYHKKRSKKELSYLKQEIDNANYKCITIEYGDYAESHYIELLSVCKFVVWHGCPESQGMALLEALSMNVPVLVIDATSLRDELEYDKIYDSMYDSIKVTSAPYFDSRCGIKINAVYELNAGIYQMESNADTFEPRAYVLDNLSLRKQANELVNMYDTSSRIKSSNSSRLSKPWKYPLKESISEKYRRIYSTIGKIIR